MARVHPLHHSIDLPFQLAYNFGDFFENCQKVCIEILELYHLHILPIEFLSLSIRLWIRIRISAIKNLQNLLLPAGL